MRNFKSLCAALIFTLLAAACSAPGASNPQANPIKITALNDTIWSYHYKDKQQRSSYFVITFKVQGNSYFVGSASADTLELAVSQASTNTTKATYDPKKPGEILLKRPSGDEIFRPLNQNEAELISQKPGTPQEYKTIKMTLYKK